MMAVKSALQSPSTVVAPSQKSRWSKFITAIPHAQEFERLVGVVCMAFHHKSLHAQIHCDAIAFSTKTFAKDQGSVLSVYILYLFRCIFMIFLGAVRAQFSRGVPSSSTTSARPNTQSTDDALHWDDDSMSFYITHLSTPIYCNIIQSPFMTVAIVFSTSHVVSTIWNAFSLALRTTVARSLTVLASPWRTQ